MDIINKTHLYNHHTVINEICREIIDDPVLYFSALNKTEIAIINTLFKLKSKYNKVHVSQETIAKWLGITRQQVNRVIKKLATNGIIAKIHRTYDSCFYLIPDFFKQENIKGKLKTILPNILKLCFSIKQLICPSLRNKKMDNKKYKRNIYNATYHKPWDEDRVNQKTKYSGFKHISKVSCEIVESFEEAEKKALANEPSPIPKIPEKYLAERFEELSPQVTQDELEKLMTSGRDLKERVKVLESFVALKKFKKDNGME